MVRFVFLVHCHAPTDQDGVKLFKSESSREGQGVTRRAGGSNGGLPRVVNLQWYLSVGQYASGTVEDAIYPK